jgi:hypothetical protein
MYNVDSKKFSSLRTGSCPHAPFTVLVEQATMKTAARQYGPCAVFGYAIRHGVKGISRSAAHVDIVLVGTMMRFVWRRVPTGRSAGAVAMGGRRTIA